VVIGDWSVPVTRFTPSGDGLAVCLYRSSIDRPRTLSKEITRA
jgi:hypothetical protein